MSSLDDIANICANSYYKFPVLGIFQNLYSIIRSMIRIMVIYNLSVMMDKIISYILVSIIKDLSLLYFQKNFGAVTYLIIITVEYSMYKSITHSLTRLSFKLRKNFSFRIILNAEIPFYTQCLPDSNSCHVELRWF